MPISPLLTSSKGGVVDIGQLDGEGCEHLFAITPDDGGMWNQEALKLYVVSNPDFARVLIKPRIPAFGKKDDEMWKR